MKKTIISSILCFFFTATCFSQTRSTLDLLGVWTGSQLRVEFLDNTSVAVTFAGSKKQTGTYTADFLLNPSTLEMSFADGDKRLEFKCLIEFTAANQLKWETFSKTSYPRNFTRYYSTLTKVKN
ncbi:MAG: hypothetical protein QM791_22610 [Ferruginibacter sp.]